MNLLKGATRKISSQERRFLSFLKLLISDGILLTKNLLTPLAKSTLIPLGLTAAASQTNSTIQKNFFGLGTTGLIMSNKEIGYITKMVILLKNQIYL